MPINCGEPNFWLQTLSKGMTTLGTWLLVVLGWIVVSDQTNNRESNKNAYVKLDQIRLKLAEIEKSAVAHHTEGYDQKTVREIVRAIKSVGIEASSLVKGEYLESSVKYSVADFRRAITAKNFDFSKYAKVEVTDSLITRLEHAKDALDKTLLDAQSRVMKKTKTLRQSLRSALFRN